ncbi:hypothetical protein A2U01_0023727 [Trifolium medium]|uniref:Uncharacterized protein n=1 Tax=Trifolium medium TaxID=97028 RepID=A0A392NS96_9FABA|nr:hypothetical protein [Trifolium medium]
MLGECQALLLNISLQAQSSDRSYMAQTGSFEGFDTFMTTLARQVANEDKLGYSRYHITRRSLLRIWMRRCRIGEALISLL